MEEDGHESKENGEICCGYLTSVPRMEFLETVEIPEYVWSYSMLEILFHLVNLWSSCHYFWPGIQRVDKIFPTKIKVGRAKNVDIIGVELAKNAVTLPLNPSTPGPRAWIQFAWPPLTCSSKCHVSSSLFFIFWCQNLIFKTPIFK